MQPRALQLFIPAFLFYAVFFIIPYTSGYDYDILCWQIWGSHNYNEGLSNTYGNTQIPNGYMPVYNYMLYLYFAIFSKPDTQYVTILYMKLVILAIEWIGLWFVYKWTDKKVGFHWIVLVSLLNLGFSYNTLIWAQIDGMVAALIFISAYYGFYRKTMLSTLFFILALNTKVQAIVFLPIWGFFYLQHGLEQRSIKAFLMPLITIVAVQFVILIPFLGKLPQLLKALNAVDTFQYVSVMAFNYWHMMVPDVWQLSDQGMYKFGLTYKQFGLLAFFTCSFLAMFPMVRVLFFKAFKPAKNIELSKMQVWLICALVALGFFYFNTQMHERYCHPALFFLTALAVYKRDLIIPYLIFSIAYFANIERASHLLSLPDHTAIFNNVVVAVEFLLVLVYLFVRFAFTFVKQATSA